MSKQLALASACILAALTASVPENADVNVVVRDAPPAPRYEVVPMHRAGHLWAPGHWAWRDDRHVWVDGHWVRERHGMHWHPSRWEHRDGHWHLVAGGWNARPYGRRDADRDGIANRNDRDRDNDG